MDNIISELKTLKREIAANDVPMRLIDDLNRIIGMCGEKKKMQDTMAAPVPSQMEMLPAAGFGECFNPNFMIEHATINVYGTIPPTLEEI